MTDRPDESSAMTEGFGAAERGVRLTACPYPESTPEYDGWTDGWRKWHNPDSLPPDNGGNVTDGGTGTEKLK